MLCITHGNHFWKSGLQSDQRSRLQAVQHPCGAQEHRAHPHRHQPVAEVEPAEVVQGLQF
jgi:hypothetical protein